MKLPRGFKLTKQHSDSLYCEISDGNKTAIIFSPAISDEEYMRRVDYFLKEPSYGNKIKMHPDSEYPPYTNIELKFCK